MEIYKTSVTVRSCDIQAAVRSAADDFRKKYWGYYGPVYVKVISSTWEDYANGMGGHWTFEVEASRYPP